MDYDIEWSVKFWFVCKKWRNHDSVRKSVRIPVYNTDLGSNTERLHELFIADYFNIYFKSAIPRNVKYNHEYDHNYSRHGVYDYRKQMDVKLDKNMLEVYTQLYGKIGL